MSTRTLSILALLSVLIPTRPLAVSAGPELAVPGGAPLDTAVPAYAAARCGDGYLVAWATGGGIKAARISRAGTVLDSPPIELAASGQGPSVASNGASCLVAWAEEDAVWALRLGLDGAPLDPAPISVTFQGHDLTKEWANLAYPRTSAASNGDSYMIATEVFNSGNLYLATRELTAAGALVDAPSSHGNLEGCQGAIYDGGWTMALTATHTRYAVAFQFPFTCYFGQPWALAREVQFYGWPGMAVDDVRLSPRSARDVADASDGTDLLLVWNSVWSAADTANPPDPGLRALRIAADGTFLDAVPPLLSSNTSSPTAQHDGIDYLVVWFEPLAAPADAFAARLASDGTFAPAGTQLLFSGAGYGRPRLATDGAGGALLAYGVTFGTGANELRFRILTAWSPPTAAPTATPSSGAAPLDVQFAANASDLDGDPLTYAWDFGDPASGSNGSTAANPTHRYAAPGTYTIRLTVSDGHSAPSASFTLSVLPPAMTLSTKLAMVRWWRPGAVGEVRLQADLQAPRPAPGDVVSVALDGVVLLARPFSEFRRLPFRDAYLLRTRRGVTVLDLRTGRLVVETGPTRLAGLAPADGLTLEVRLGARAAAETFPVTAIDRRLLVYRR